MAHRWRVALLSFLCLFGLVTSQNVTSCQPYPATGLCSAYVNYSVYAPAGIAAVEASLSSSGLLQLQKLQNVDPSCVDTYFRYVCSASYPRCSAPTLLPGCLSTCQEVNATCGLVFGLMNTTNYLPNCNAPLPGTNITLQGDNSCNLLQPLVSAHSGLNMSAIPDSYIFPVCPPPFLPDPVARADPTKSTSKLTCRHGCCIPCPFQNYFYYEGWVEHAYMATDIIRSVSAVCSLFIVVSYLVLPDKRRHPSLLILHMSIAIFIFSFVAFFPLGDPRRIQCHDAVTVSTQENNVLCAAQGSLLIFGSLGTVCWCAALIINLHLHTVWNYNFFHRRYWLLYIICWGIPAAFMGVCLGLKQVEFVFTNLCLVSLDQIFNFFFYPMAAIVVPSFVIHIFTFLYIARIAFREGIESDMSQSFSNASVGRTQRFARHKHVIQAVHIQWRALLLAIISCVTVLFYWVFYFTQLRRVTTMVNDSSVVNNWIGCMINPQSANQDSCVSIIADYVPPFGFMIAAEALVSVIGIWLVIIFAKRSLFIEWNDLIYNVRVYFGGRDRAEKHGEQFFQL
ncbi:hypothetical protein DM01DRAFT_1407379 [Hesseltinella vesiculosa]|uniref:G-protein coupled receptors family 2 profile 2 domain-containing protein n=1 Tax=Hesseltinella vesiculosa TaxID=101127 RepID=A0A1X2GIF8_9FUNG|nr:hypothetical protein DM01DRAFT_1407379 [Hesseltinella vesiculosa]